MSASLSLSEPRHPGHLRAQGTVSARFAIGHRGTRIADLYETGGFRLKFPFKNSDTAEAILVNTGGGMTGGDTLNVDITAEAATRAVVTTQSAEKIYRSSGATAQLRTHIALEADCTFAWVPQETILFFRRACCPRTQRGTARFRDVSCRRKRGVWPLRQRRDFGRRLFFRYLADKAWWPIGLCRKRVEGGDKTSQWSGATGCCRAA